MALIDYAKAAIQDWYDSNQMSWKSINDIREEFASDTDYGQIGYYYNKMDPDRIFMVKRLSNGYKVPKTILSVFDFVLQVVYSYN